MITFTPLSEHFLPSHPSDSKDQQEEAEVPKALAYLAEVDDVRILVDCGAPESFDFCEQSQDSLPEVLRKLAPSINLVLLCHSTLSHIGLYAYARAHWGLTAPCFATLPVATMGRLTTLEAVVCLRNDKDVDAEFHEDDKKQYIATVDEVNAAYDEISTLRYFQPTQLEGKCAGLTLTAYGAGHSLGGAVWKLRSPTSGTLLIALDWNHMRERHIDGTALIATASAASASSVANSSGGIIDAVRRPDLLISSIGRASHVNARRKDRDAALVDLIHSTIRSGHSVLIPVDASARLLELLVLLDQHWAYAYPHARFPLCLVSSTGREVIERARTLMEWMTREWATKSTVDPKQAEEEDVNGQSKSGGRSYKKNANGPQAPASPLDFKFLRVFSTLKAMDDAMNPSEPRVVLAWPPSMSHGPSRKLFARMAINERDVVLLTSRGDSNSLSRQLWKSWEERQSAQEKWGRGKVGQAIELDEGLDLKLDSRVFLEGKELEVYLEAQRAAKEKEAHQRALLARSHRRLEADEEDEASSGSESEEESVIDDGEGGQPRVSGGASKLSMDDSRGSGLESLGPGGEVSFDIYLKGNAKRATSFFGSSSSSTGVRFRMFPVIEKRKRVDAYGETLDIGRWLSRRRQLESDAARTTGEDESAESKRRKTQEDKKAKEEKELEEKPSKFVSDHVHLQLRCRLAFVDMEGLGDGRALKTLLPQLHPRRLILVEGDANASKEMISNMLSVPSMTRDVFSPKQLEAVTIGELTASLTVNLGEGLLGSLDLSRFEDYEVAQLRAKVKYAMESTVPTLEQPDTGTKEQLEEVMRANDGNLEQSNVHAQKTSSVSTLFIGDLRLSTLKAALASSHRMASEFAGEGTLVCGPTSAWRGTMDEDSRKERAFRDGHLDEGAVTVRKVGQGEIIIEGNLSRGFYRVRDAVYGLHAKVSG